MKKLIIVSVLSVAAIFSFCSCDMLDFLKNYEEYLSLTDEEYSELIKGKWQLTAVGRSLEFDDTYHEEHVVNDPDNPASSSIDYIVFKDNESPVIYFKESVLFEVNTWNDSKEIYETSTSSYKEFAVDTDEQLLKFGCMDGSGSEFFILYLGRAGGIINYQINFYGIEKGDSYEVKRIILSADNYTYYEFKPVK